MEPVEDLPVNPAPAPVFVDDTGRRQALIRRLGRFVVIGFAAYIGLLVVGLTRDPRVGPVHLPTFGLPSLGLMTPPAPTVLGQEAARAATGSEVVTNGSSTPARTTSQSGRVRDPRPSMTSTLVSSSPASPSTTATPSLAPAASTTTTTAPTNPGHGSKSSSTTTTTTTSSTSGTPTTPTTTSTTNNGQGSGASSARGPDGTGAPGQLRKPTKG